MHKATVVDDTVGILTAAWAVVSVVERALEVKVPAVDLAGAVIDNMVIFCCYIELI